MYSPPVEISGPPVKQRSPITLNIHRPPPLPPLNPSSEHNQFTASRLLYALLWSIYHLFIVGMQFLSDLHRYQPCYGQFIINWGLSRVLHPCYAQYWPIQMWSIEDCKVYMLHSPRFVIINQSKSGWMWPPPTTVTRRLSFTLMLWWSPVCLTRYLFQMLWWQRKASYLKLQWISCRINAENCLEPLKW